MLTRTMPRERLRRAVRRSALAAFVLHSGAVVYLWRSWGAGLRGGLVVWMDFPTSLIYLGVEGRAFLVWSLIAGGLQWAAIGALLAYGLGRLSLRSAGTPRPGTS